MIITSINNQIVKDTVKLHQKKYRDEQSLFLMEGYHLYEEALKHGIIKTIFTTDENIQGHNVIHVSQQVLEKISQMKSTQGVLVVCAKIKKNEITDRVLILEKIQDPGNLGTLLRSALGFDFKTVILDNTCDLYNDKVIRSTQGNLFKLNIIEMNTIDFMNEHNEYTYYGTEMNGESLTTINKDNKIAIILGNEGNGVSKEVLSKTSKNISIKTNIESLNVGVAGSIIMHHIYMGE